MLNFTIIINTNTIKMQPRQLTLSILFTALAFFQLQGQEEYFLVPDTDLVSTLECKYSNHHNPAPLSFEQFLGSNLTKNLRDDYFNQSHFLREKLEIKSALIESFQSKRILFWNMAAINKNKYFSRRVEHLKLNFLSN